MVTKLLVVKKIAVTLGFLCLTTVFITSRFHIITNEATESGGDQNTYKQAIETFISGGNPYDNTVKSFANLKSDPGGKGFSYPPFFLFLYSPFHAVHLYLQANYPCELGINITYRYCYTERLYFNLLGLLADVGTGISIFVIMRKLKIGYLPILISLLVWFFNPYIYKSKDYYPNDLIVIFLTTLALYFAGIKKDQVLTGFFIGLAFSTKMYPVLLFPIIYYLFVNNVQDDGHKNNFLRFIYTKITDFRYLLISSLLPLLLLSLPFMTSLDNFKTYLHGSLLVQSERFVQGRPFLYYISYFYKVEFIRMVSFNTYTVLAGISGLVASSGLIILSKVRVKSEHLARIQTHLKQLLDVFFLSTVIMAGFYVFTPVLNRTYLLWIIPSLCISSFSSFRGKKVVFGYLLVAMFWLFYYLYLLPWKDGFHIWHP